MRKIIIVVLALFMLCTVCIMAETSENADTSETKNAETDQNTVPDSKQETGKDSNASEEDETVSEDYDIMLLADNEPAPANAKIINVEPNENGITSCTINGTEYKFGFADGHGQFMMMDGAFGISGGNRIEVMLGIAVKDDKGEFTIPASADIYSLVDLDSVRFSTIPGNSNVVASFYLSDSVAEFNDAITTKKITVNSSTEYFGKTQMVLSFDLKTNKTDQNADVYHITIKRGIISSWKDSLKLDLSDVSDMNGLNAIFSSKEAFLAYCNTHFSGHEVSKSTEIRITLPEKTFNGVLQINCGTAGVDFKDLAIIGNNPDPLHKPVINGGIEIISGNPSFENLKIAGSESAKINDKKIGIYSVAEGTGDYNSNDINNITGVEFTGLDYGIYVKGCNASTVTSSTFVDCGTGIYLDSEGTLISGHTNGNIFENCNIGIDLVSFGFETNMFDYYDMFFFNENDDYIDVLVHDDRQYTMTGSFFGVDRQKASCSLGRYPEGVCDDNARPAVVKTTGDFSNQLATNPCLKYPNEGLWGIDVPVDSSYALVTRVVYGKFNALPIKKSDLSIAEIQLAMPGKTEALGSLSFGGNK